MFQRILRHKRDSNLQCFVMKIMSSKLMSSTWQRCNISNLWPMISNKFASPDIWNPPPQVSNCLNWQNSVNWNKQWGYKNRKQIREAFKTKQKKKYRIFYDQYEQKYITYEKFHIFYGKASLIPEDSLKNILDWI